MSLRELLASAIVSGDPYPLLKALIEAVEPEPCVCDPPSRLLDDLYYMIDDWHEWHDVGKSIKRLRKCAETTERRIKTKQSRLYAKLAEAKAEVERLRGQCKSEELCKGYPGLCTEAEAVDKSIKADAEIGRLVRGMADRTCLIRGHPSHAICQKQMYYWVEKQSKGARSGMPLCDWRKVEGKYLKTDPAEALRAIQEVSDACDLSHR